MRSCEDVGVVSPRPRSSGRQLTRWGTRAHLVVRTTRREVAYRWTTPRSPALRVLVAPLFIGGLVLLLLVGALAMVLALVGAVLAVVALAFVTLAWSVAARLNVSRRRPRR
jgi:uncharacterized membrane protein